MGADDAAEGGADGGGASKVLWNVETAEDVVQDIVGEGRRRRRRIHLFDSFDGGAPERSGVAEARSLAFHSTRGGFPIVLQHAYQFMAGWA